MTRRFSAVVGGLALVLSVACGGAPDLIDRTQPNYMKKSELLSATWYVQETIVDVPPTTTVAAIGFGSGLDKVRFEIQEDHLVAFRSYEYLPGLDPLVDREKSTIGKTVTLDGKPYKGAPVAAYPIVGHFDRVRQYNAATGEQSNVLEENATDRPWYERDYIRVDWSKNVISNLFSVTGGLAAPMQVHVTPIDQNAGDSAFVTEYVNVAGKNQLNYFDFTTRVYFDPPKVYYPGYGTVPYCWMNPKLDCESSEVKIGTSVRRVDEAHVQDYEPLVYGDKVQKKFGYFRTERLSYDRNRSVTESGRITLANRHNIWKRAHADTGEVIPLEQREAKPIVYFLTPNFPKELMPSVQGIEDSWNRAFRRSVEVSRTGSSPPVPEKMFYVCETPVPEGAPEACGPRGFQVRLGDLRYNQVPWIDQPQLAGPLGLGPSAADPETGEIIQGVANVYGAGIDTWTGDAQTIVDVLNGDLKIEELVAGKNATDYVFEKLNATDPRRHANGPATSKQPLVAAPPDQALGTFGRIAGTLKTRIDGMRLEGTPPLMREDRRRVVERMVAQHPALESELINSPEVRALVLANAPGSAFRQKLEADPGFYRQVARQEMLGGDAIEQLNNDRVHWASTLKNHGCLYLAEFTDDAWIGMAKQMKALKTAAYNELKGQGMSDVEAMRGARDRVWTELRLNGYRAIAEHEIGHTLGLTHNFVGSYDAMNYKDGYWDLRKQTIGIMVGGQRVLPVTPQNLVDAAEMNQAQVDGKMREYQYSSIMDYGARMNSDVHGIGKYDDAAILFAYSGGGSPGWVEVFTDVRRDNATVQLPTDTAGKSLMVRSAAVEFPFTNVTHFNPLSRMITDRFHYTTLPFFFADAGAPFAQAVDQGIQRMGKRAFRKWSELEPIYALIEDEVHQRALRRDDIDLSKIATAQHWLDLFKPDWQTAVEVMANVPNAPIEVPYMYCSDMEVGSNQACNRWDEGADQYEIVKDWISRYRDYYPFTNFKRDRYEYGPQNVMDRNFGRLLSNLPNVYQHWLFDIFWTQKYNGVTTEQMDQLGSGDPMFQNYWTMAVVDGVNVLLSALAQPSAGYHGKLLNGSWVHLPANNAANGRLTPEREARFVAEQQALGYPDVVYVPRGPGRSMFTLYDGEGYDFFTRVNEVGHFWDQIGALSALTTSDTNFLGVDRGADALRYSIPYYLIFNRELSTVISDVWTENRAGYAGSLAKVGNGEATFVPPTLLRAENYIAGFSYPPPPVQPVDTNGQPAVLERVEASPTWSTRFYSESWGMMYFTENLNPEFANLNQVFRMGSGESVTPATGFEVVQFADPFGGGFSYAALHRTGSTTLTPGPKMIQTGAEMKAKWDLARAAPNGIHEGLTAAQWEAKVRDNVRSLEMMRGLYSIFGSVTW